MIRNALTGEPRPTPAPAPASPQDSDFTAEGAPAPGHTTGNALPDAQVGTPDGADAVAARAALRGAQARDMASVARALAVLWQR